MNGWDIDTLQEAVTTCTNPSGRVEDCPVFANSLQTELEQNMCKIEDMPKALQHDNCAGPSSDGICGNVPIQYGPGYADPIGADKPNKPSKPTHSSVDLPTQSYAPARSTAAGGISVYNVDVNVAPSSSSSSSSSSSPSPSSPTSAAPIAAITPVVEVGIGAGAGDEDGNIISTSTYVKDGVVYEVVIKEVITYVTVDAKRRRHSHKHRRNREHGLLGRN